MNKTKNTNLTDASQKLRRNMTKEEKHLWYDFLKILPYTVNRQKVIGRYIVDFSCADRKIVIEIDGSQHYEKENKEKDKVRDEYLKSLGCTVLRYMNLDVNRRFEAVCSDIMNHLECPSSVSKS